MAVDHGNQDDLTADPQLVGLCLQPPPVRGRFTRGPRRVGDPHQSVPWARLEIREQGHGPNDALGTHAWLDEPPGENVAPWLGSGPERPPDGSVRGHPDVGSIAQRPLQTAPGRLRRDHDHVRPSPKGGQPSHLVAISNVVDEEDQRDMKGRDEVIGQLDRHVTIDLGDDDVTSIRPPSDQIGAHAPPGIHVHDHGVTGGRGFAVTHQTKDLDRETMLLHQPRHQLEGGRRRSGGTGWEPRHHPNSGRPRMGRAIGQIDHFHAGHIPQSPSPLSGRAGIMDSSRARIRATNAATSLRRGMPSLVRMFDT